MRQVFAAVMAAVLVLFPALAGAQDVPIDAVGRLFIIHDGGRSRCTAFAVKTERLSGIDYVVYLTWFVTAGHCLAGAERISFSPALRDHSVWGERIMGYSEVYDVGVFTAYSARPMPVLTLTLDEPADGAPLMLIGYGGGALLARVGPLIGRDEVGNLLVHSYASRGVSGGPVLIPGTRHVVGIGIQTTLDPPKGASWMYCALFPCAVKPPYVAAPIRHVMGLMRVKEALP